MTRAKSTEPILSLSLQLTDSVTKKADKAAAQADILELKAKLAEAVSGQDAEKEQLREQLVQLHGQVEELTEKALRMEKKQLESGSYEQRMEQVEQRRAETQLALDQAEARIGALGAEMAEQRAEAEETRKMMMEVMKTLEQEAADKKTDEGKEELEAKIRDLEKQLEEAKKLGEEEQKKVDALKEEIATISTSSSSHEELVAEHTQELDDMRKMMVTEIAALETQLEAANLKISEAPKTEVLQNTILELTEAQKTSETKILELASAADELKKVLEASELKVQGLTASIEEAQKLTAAAEENQKSTAEALNAKHQEAQKATAEASDAKILELTAALGASEARILELATTADENQKAVGEASDAKHQEAQEASEALEAKYLTASGNDNRNASSSGILPVQQNKKITYLNHSVKKSNDDEEEENNIKISKALNRIIEPDFVAVLIVGQNCSEKWTFVSKIPTFFPGSSNSPVVGVTLENEHKKHRAVYLVQCATLQDLPQSLMGHVQHILYFFSRQRVDSFIFIMNKKNEFSTQFPLVPESVFAWNTSNDTSQVTGDRISAFCGLTVPYDESNNNDYLFNCKIQFMLRHLV